MASPSQQPDQDPTIHLTAFSGMKNTVSRETLTPDELEAAINIDIDDKGKLHRRRGQTLVSSGTFHSLFNADDWTLIGVKNGTLGVINPDYSFQPIAYMIGDQTISGGTLTLPDPTAPPFEDTNPIVYRQVGSTIYFTSATNSAKAAARLNSPARTSAPAMARFRIPASTVRRTFSSGCGLTTRHSPGVRSAA